MLVDANLLLYAVDSESPRHGIAVDWLTKALNGDRRIGFPHPSLWAFLRIATHPRVFRDPLDISTALDLVDAWLAPQVSWIPMPGARHLSILRDLVIRHQVRRDLVSDAVLVALALEHGLPVASADADFARFSEIEWVNPFDG